MNKAKYKFKDFVYLIFFYLILEHLSEMTMFYPSMHQDPFWVTSAPNLVLFQIHISIQKTTFHTFYTIKDLKLYFFQL